MALTPKVLGNYLNFPLDGSIFNTANGYVRQSYPSIALVNLSATTDMFVNVNNQVVNSLASAMNLNGFNFSTTALGFPASIALLGQTSLQVINNSISLTATPKIVWGWMFGFQANIQANIVPQISAGSSSSLLQIRPYFQNINYSNVTVSLFGKTVGITFVANLISDVFEWLSNRFLPYIKIPQIPESNARVTDAYLSFPANYISAGLTLSY